MAIMVGSARIDENGNIAGGQAGDQTGREVSTEAMYTHSKGWYILRPKSVAHANAIAERMMAACNNNNIGYDQNNRLGVVTWGINTSNKTECDCSSLVRQCVKEATGRDPGNFTTGNEASALEATGLFESRQSYVSQAATPVYNGDVLVTKTKGHTVVVVSGNPRKTAAPAPADKKVDITYQVYTDHWLPAVKNLEDFAGIEGKPIKGLAVCGVSAGRLEYQVHANGKWYGRIWAENYDPGNLQTGFAGDLVHEIDAIRAYYYTPDDIRPYKQVMYRVDTVKRKVYYAWQADFDTDDGQDGYAGVLGGAAIDRVQMCVQ